MGHGMLTHWAFYFLGALAVMPATLVLGLIAGSLDDAFGTLIRLIRRS